MKDIQELIKRYSEFVKTQNDKISFILEVLLSFYDEFILLSKDNNPIFKDYLQNILSNITLIQDIMYTCEEEVNSILENQLDLNCLSYIKLLNIKISLLEIANHKCKTCCDVIKKCINKVI